MDGGELQILFFPVIGAVVVGATAWFSVRHALWRERELKRRRNNTAQDDQPAHPTGYQPSRTEPVAHG